MRLLLQILLAIVVLGVLAAVAKGLFPLAPGIAMGFRWLGHPLVLLAIVLLVVLVRLRPRRRPDERQ